MKRKVTKSHWSSLWWYSLLVIGARWKWWYSLLVIGARWKWTVQRSVNVIHVLKKMIAYRALVCNGNDISAKIEVTLMDDIWLGPVKPPRRCLSWVGIFMVEISPCGYKSTNVVTPPLSGDLQVEILIQILAYSLHFWPTEIQSNCYILLVKNSDYKEYPTNYEDFLFES